MASSEGVPTSRPAALDRLDVLVGRWEMEASFEAGYFGPGSAAVSGRVGHTEFEWLEGGFFLLQRSVADQPAIPSGITIIGVAAEPETFTGHYFGSLGVEKVFQMSVGDGIWKLWVTEPGGGFWQRCTATISGDGRWIDGTWEMSHDGTEWVPDFRMAFIRVI